MSRRLRSIVASRRKGIVAAVVAGSLVLGCSTMQQPEQPVLKACLGDSQQIGSAGGTISVGNYTLVIPEGALLQTTTITVEQEVCGDWPVRLGPDGTQFAVPVTLQMDASSESDPGSMDVMWWNPSTSQWVTLSSTHSGSTVSASLSHFSRYTLG